MLPRSRSGGGGGMEGWGGGVSALQPRRIPGLVLYALAALIRTRYAWALRWPSRLMVLAAALAALLLALLSAPWGGIIILSGLFPPLSHRHTTFLEPPMTMAVRQQSTKSDGGKWWH
jgi:hypothetical protein